MQCSSSLLLRVPPLIFFQRSDTVPLRVSTSTLPALTIGQTVLLVLLLSAAIPVTRRNTASASLESPSSARMRLCSRGFVYNYYSNTIASRRRVQNTTSSKLYSNISKDQKTPLNVYDLKTPLYNSHVPTSIVQKGLLAIGSAFTGLIDPQRGEAIATLGETTGYWALRRMHSKMQKNPIGREILATKPRVNEQTLDYAALRTLGPETFGRVYADWMAERHFSPDERTPVRLVDDLELAYVMTRYREVHDFWHVLLGPLPTSVFAELAVKWVETVQLGLPMSALSAVVAPLRLSPQERSQLVNEVIPWAFSTARNSVYLMNVYYERHLTEPLVEVQRQLRITPPRFSFDLKTDPHSDVYRQVKNVG